MICRLLVPLFSSFHIRYENKKRDKLKNSIYYYRIVLYVQYILFSLKKNSPFLVSFEITHKLINEKGEFFFFFWLFSCFYNGKAYAQQWTRCIEYVCLYIVSWHDFLLLNSLKEEKKIKIKK